MIRRTKGRVVLPSAEILGSSVEYVRQKPKKSSADQW